MASGWTHTHTHFGGLKVKSKTQAHAGHSALGLKRLIFDKSIADRQNLPDFFHCPRFTLYGKLIASLHMHGFGIKFQLV